ncbi:DUF6318 family protein [Pimelobacter simplex]|uniref:DUF6318 family protein n=2 Tax=Nocardioides simplex TaxID=2045 RepID=UPI001F3CC65E|nr:DUF6318 family protein [Pimelobacter simplex]
MVPVLPGAAKEASEEGARAFVGYYWELVNYAQATGDVRRLRRVSGPRCAACSDFISRVLEQYQSGGRIVGGTNSVTIDDLSEVTTSTASAFGFKVTATVSYDAQTIVAHDGDQDKRSPGSDVFTAYLLWVESKRWRLDVLQVAPR